MKTCARPAVPLLLLASLSFVQWLPAHGGQYRGPGCVVPPAAGSGTSLGSGSGSSGGGGSGNSGTSGGGSAPTVTAPSPSGAPLASAGSRAGGRARGAALDDDLGRWEFWWEFGKDPWLRLRDAIFDEHRVTIDDAMLRRGPLATMVPVQRPNDADLATTTAALAVALKAARDRDTVSSCMVALAKIGRDAKHATLHDLFEPWLQSGDQELRETAALAYGIAGQAKPEHLDLLAALVADDAEGRRLSGGAAVNERTRAFAVYAQGLLLARHPQGGTGHRIVTQLGALLAKPEAHGRDLKVAVIEALARFPATEDSAAAKVLRQTVLDVLETYYKKDLGPGERLLQAHVPPAFARLVPPAAEVLRLRYRDLLLADLRAGLGNSVQADARGGNLFVAQSCALALGDLAMPWRDATDPDADVGAALLQAYREHRDQQTRAFALVGLARQGGEAAKAALLQELERAGRAIEQPWCAMALGVLHARAQQAATKTGGSADPDERVTTALRKALQTARNPSSQGALAIAMGLCGDRDGADQLRAVLVESRQRDEVAGYVALALGLLRDRLATAEVRDLLHNAERRPILMLQCVRALGLLGDVAVADELCKALQDPDPSLVRLSAIAAALGQIGDRRSLQPLQAMLANDKLTPLTRAFAAVALGRVCDKDPLPWNSAYATHTNYRASTETLTNGSNGILDIL